MEGGIKGALRCTRQTTKRVPNRAGTAYTISWGEGKRGRKWVGEGCYTWGFNVVMMEKDETMGVKYEGLWVYMGVQVEW